MRADMEEHHPIWGSQVPASLVYICSLLDSRFFKQGVDIFFSVMFQVHMVTRPTCMFMNLRHLSCEIKIVSDGPNRHSGLLQLASYLELAPQLETIQLHVSTLLPMFLD